MQSVNLMGSHNSVKNILCRFTHKLDVKFHQKINDSSILRPIVFEPFLSYAGNVVTVEILKRHTNEDINIETVHTISN